jgi:hypothetical protein
MKSSDSRFSSQKWAIIYLIGWAALLVLYYNRTEVEFEKRRYDYIEMLKVSAKRLIEASITDEKKSRVLRCVLQNIRQLDPSDPSYYPSYFNISLRRKRLRLSDNNEFPKGTSLASLPDLLAFREKNGLFLDLHRDMLAAALTLKQLEESDDELGFYLHKFKQIESIITKVEKELDSLDKAKSRSGTRSTTSRSRSGSKTRSGSGSRT